MRKYLTRYRALFIAILYFVLEGVFGLTYYNYIFRSEENMAYTYEKLIYNSFFNINYTVQRVEKIIRDNSSFFKNYDRSVNGEEIIKIVQLSKELKTNDTYIEDVIFYKVDNNYLITTDGTIDKDDFFNYAYYNSDFNRLFWDDIMIKYNTPTFVPLNNYSLQKKSMKRLFIIPKIYPLYDVGVILFVDEQDFVNYFGLSNAPANAKIRLYDQQGNLILSNVSDPIDTKLELSKIQNAPADVEKSFFGLFRINKWVDYENMIFSYERRNASFLWFFIGSLILLGIAGGVYILLGQIGVLKSGSRRLEARLLTVMSIKNKDFFQANRELLEELFPTSQKKTYQFVRILFFELKKGNIPLGEEIEAILKNRCLVFVTESNYVDALLMFKTKNQGELSDWETQLKGKIGEGVRIVWGEFFDEAEKLYQEYQRFMLNMGKLGPDFNQTTTMIPDLPVNLKAYLGRFAAEDNRKGLKKYLEEIIDQNIQENASIDSFYYLFTKLYYEMVAVAANGMDGQQLLQIHSLFYDGLKNNLSQLDITKMKNVLFNTANYLMDYSGKDSPKLHIKDITKYIEEHFTENIYLDYIAEHFQMTAKYFSYFFKKELGVGFNDYLTQLRLEESKKLLKTRQDLSINEISKRIGYQNSATFIMAFKKNMGETPGQFRELH